MLSLYAAAIKLAVCIAWRQFQNQIGPSLQLRSDEFAG